MMILDDTVKEFLAESFENLEHLDRDLLSLENEPNDAETLNRIFRVIHTIKGTCGFFNYRALEKVSHAGETLLDHLRSSAVSVTPEVVTSLLRLCDALREILSVIEQTGAEGTAAYTDLLAQLERYTPTPVSSPNGPQTAQLPTDQLESEEDGVGPSLAAESAGGDGKVRDRMDTALRVDVRLLDKLMNLVGELVLARNQILQFTKVHRDSEFAGTSQRLNLITSELQDSVMRTRMQPISTVWNKLPRIVRDVAQACGKEVNLTMEGKDTELDKTIIEAIKDPLTHIIRNSLDHGLESPAMRRHFGKSMKGTVSLRAFHEGGQVVIEVADDGHGLDTERIRAKAVEKGLLSQEKAGGLQEADIHRLIFLPGFSTAERITNISGRGVGMDVVRANIEGIGGTVDVSSVPHQGTTFTIKIPLTLAIVPALVVSTAGSRFAIPQVNLIELVRIEPDRVANAVEHIEGSRFHRLRGKILPLVSLGEALQLTEVEPSEKGESRTLSLVVVRADNHQFGLIVDKIQDTEEIVVKPLGKKLKSVSAFSGATIMGDGQVALILDIGGIARHAQIAREERKSAELQCGEQKQLSSNQNRMFIFGLSAGRRAAVPLSQVYRLEQVRSEAIEQSTGQPVIQYRNSILPLIDLRQALVGERTPLQESLRLFVHKSGDRLVGFIIDEILDIVDEDIDLQHPYRDAAVSGAAVLQGKVTDIIDLPSVLAKARVAGECVEPWRVEV